MKNMCTILIAILFGSTLNAQVDTASLVVKSDENVYLYRQNFKNENDFDGGSVFNYFIIFNRKYSPIRFIRKPLEVYTGKQFRFVDMNQLDLNPSEIRRINNWNTEDYEKRKKEAILLDSLLTTGVELKEKYLLTDNQQVKQDREDSIRLSTEIKKLKLLGIGIHYDWEEEQLLTTNSQSFKFEVYNFSKKEIKYVYITLGMYNRVDDIFAKKQVTMVGPIEPGDFGSAEFKNLQLSNVFEYALLNEVKIQYIDGTVKIFTKTNANNLRMSLNLQDYLHND
jgi:hypothetical protein